MKRTFVETRPFTARLKSRLGDEAYRELQKLLLANPDAGAVMPGCGGLRKMRFAEEGRGKGKRGGVRVIYLHMPSAERIDFVTIYDKGEKEGLSADEKKAFRKLAELIHKEAAAKALKEVTKAKGAQHKRDPKKEK